MPKIPDDRTPEAYAVSAAGVESIFADLKPRERVILELRVFQGMPFCELAEIMGMTEGNVRLVFHRLIAKLRARFKSSWLIWQKKNAKKLSTRSQTRENAE